MKNLTESFKKIVPFLANSLLAQTDLAPFDFVRSKETMFKELEFCRKTRNLVGVYSSNLGNGMFLVGVEEIVHGDDGALIIFYNYDMSGHQLARRTMSLDEISMIVPFNNPYVNPLHFQIHPVKATAC